MNALQYVDKESTNLIDIHLMTELLDRLYMLNRDNQKEREKEMINAWNLMSLDNTRESIPEISLLMFVCSVLQYETQFIKAVKAAENNSDKNYEES